MTPTLVTLSREPDADFAHTVEFERDGDDVFLHEQDERGRFTTLMWPRDRVPAICRALMEAAG
jgi:hypothetical protein